MRAIFMLATLLVASMPVLPVPLSVEAPQIIIDYADCSSAGRSARVLASALGYSATRVSCRGRGAIAFLDGRKPAAVTMPPNFLTYSTYSRLPSNETAPRVSSTFEVPSDVPFIAARGDIEAYTKLDALVMLLRPDNATKTAFELEDAGIGRNDITTLPGDASRLLVRVWPITATQTLKIESAVERAYGSSSFPSIKMGFVKDCDGTIASLGALALAQTERHANVMAQAAHTSLGSVLGVVDPGGTVTDAVCGIGADATMQQLALAFENAPSRINQGNSHLYATFVRSIYAAWRAGLPPNGQGRSWWTNQQFNYRSSDKPAFFADGVPVMGEALLPGVVLPDRVTIGLPNWSYDALLKSAYSKHLTYLDYGIGPLTPAVNLENPNAGSLQKQIAQFRAYFTSVAQREGKSADLTFRYSRTNCQPAIDAAIFRATQDAIKKLGGKHLRYLQQYSAQTIGEVSCMYEPTERDQWSPEPLLLPAGSLATVSAAY